MLSTVVLVLFSALSAPDASISDLSTASTALLNGLSPEQRAITAFDFDSEARWDWHYVPRERVGLSFNDLKEDQYPLLLNVLRAALSDAGYSMAETIRSLEKILREMEGPQATHRDYLDYHLSIFGTPEPDGTWALRYEGHHLSLHWTIVNGKAIATTPQFLGANPGEVMDGPHAGTRALGVFEDLGRDLVSGLSEEQRAAAVVSDSAPRDILSGTQRDAIIQDDLGVAYGALSTAQQASVMGIIEAYANIQRPEVAAQRLTRIRKAGMDSIKFAWMGGTAPGEKHYYRIQGKTFLIEYDNVQNNAKHPHTVWRDFHGDFGKDLLKEHYAHHAH